MTPARSTRSRLAGGVKVMSFGYIVDADQPVIWRGPMLQKALEQFVGDVLWGELDYLVVDLPPGTGDVALTLCQNVPLEGAVIVTTPQDVALIDARKSLHMFRKLEVPVLGIIENMSHYTCPECGHIEPVFGSGGGRRTAEALGVPFLGEIPIDPAVAAGGDTGKPVVLERPQSPVGRAFTALAEAILERAEEVRAPGRSRSRSRSRGPTDGSVTRTRRAIGSGRTRRPLPSRQAAASRTPTPVPRSDPASPSPRSGRCRAERRARERVGNREGGDGGAAGYSPPPSWYDTTTRVAPSSVRIIAVTLRWPSSFEPVTTAPESASPMEKLLTATSKPSASSRAR